MPLRYIFAIMISIILITLVVIFNGQRSQQLNHSSIHAKHGFIDISSAIKQDQSVDLSGEWLFFYKQFLSSQEIQAGKIKAQPINVPENWKLTNYDPQAHSTLGFGTYYLQVKTGQTTQSLAINLPIIYSAYRLYVDDQLFVTVGNAAQNENDQIPRYQPHVLPLNTNNAVINLTLQVANYQSDWGGIRYPLIIGKTETLFQNEKINSMERVFLGAFLFAIAIYNLILFSFRKTDFLPLIFALICFTFGLREFFVGNYIILNYLPDLTFAQLDRVEHLTFFISSPLLMHFYYLSFPPYFSKRFLISTYLVALVLSLILLTYQNYTTVFVMQLLVPFYITYTLYTSSLAWKGKQKGIEVILLGSIILGGSVINDILYAHEWINTTYLSSLGVAIYVLSQSYMTGIKFNQDFLRNENLSRRLTRRNAILENLTLKFEAKVKGRTEELAEANKRLKLIAQTDPLTQIANRYGIEDIIKHEEARFKRSTKAYAIAVLDLDHFKIINDRYGHDGGDEVLKRTATLIKQNIREQDKIARWGGEEFIILLPETNLYGASIIANKIRNVIEQATIKTHGHELKITATIGVAEAQYGESFDAVFKRADVALFKGKKIGRNIVLS